MSLILKAKKKGLIFSPAVFYKASGGGGPAASFRGVANGDQNSTTRTFSIDLGTATSDRLIVVALGIQFAAATNIVVAGTTITTPDITGNNGGANTLAIYSSLVTTGSGLQTITVNGVVGFEEVGISVWACTGLSSNTVKHSNYGTGQPLSMNVTAGDFMFAMDATSNFATTFLGSTENPTAPAHVVDAVGPCYNSAEWISIVSTNAAFSIAGTGAGGTTSLIAATYR